MVFGFSLKSILPSKDQTNVIIGAAGASIVEPFVDNILANFVPQQTIFGGVGIDDLAKIGLGAFLAKKSGILKGIGISLLVTGTQRIVSGLIPTAAVATIPAVTAAPMATTGGLIG